MLRVKVSSKYHIAVPAAVRRQLQIRPGDYLLAEVRGGQIVLIPEPRDYCAHLRGRHREIWEEIEPQDYVRREREAWETS